MSGVRGAAVLAVLWAMPALAQDCVPACRSGFVCLQGLCKSRCNPACPSGTECLDTGECAPIAPPPPGAQSNQNQALPPPPPPPPPEPTYGQPPPPPQQRQQYQPPPPPPPQPYQPTYQPPYQPPPTYQPQPGYQPGYQPPYQPGYQPGPPSAAPAGLRVSLGWARAAGVIGIVSASVGAVLTVMILAFDAAGLVYGIGSPATVTGLITTGFLGVMMPVIAGGAGSARGDSEVSGSGVLRAFGWIGFAAFLVGVVVATSIGLLLPRLPIAGFIGAMATTAVVSTLFFSLDAFISASQASSVNEQRGFTARPRLTHTPLLAVLPSPTGTPGVMAGWRIGF